ncbi:hypothetical protein [Brevundimonas sp. Root1279]|uniref:hypothetical protein n=1 Tax=Brevundimonas sp. Root1279 TaxID=1736443 RepID=UPI0006FBE7A6|nr:hypothetical protein [Brevundimonas sp. Root1279]KQW79744.1 hypothetical protein ASC65_14445 [Brevundimonas sp. Root1279]
MITLALALLVQSAELPRDIPVCIAYHERLVRRGESSAPAIGEERASDVGDPILVASRYEVRDAGLTLSEPLVISGTTSRAPFTLIIPVGTGIVEEPAGYSARGYVFNGQGPKPTAVHFEPDGSGNPVARVSWGWVKERHQITQGVFRTAPTECVSVPRDSLTRQLAFTGISRGVVSLEYREFSGDMARPAFTQVATYDLADGTTIGFRGARIEVLSADNTEIRYRILRTFD